MNILFNYTCTAMSFSNPTSVEEGKETQVATETKGEVDSQSVDEPEATEGTSSWPSESVKRISWRPTNPLRRRRMVVALSV